MTDAASNPHDGVATQSGVRSKIQVEGSVAPAKHAYIFGLDVVRASAISLVILSHMVFKLEFLGILGVELFFVLSGYLVGGIFLRAIVARKKHYATMLLAFWRRRWARTLPNYFLFLLLAIPLSAEPFPDWARLARYVVFAQNLWYPVDSLFQISWSLAVEEWFYLLLPGMTTLFLISRQKAVPSIVAACAVLIVGSAVLRLFPSIDDFNRGMRMVVIYRLDALAFGVVGAILAHFRPVAWRGWARAWPVGFVVLVALGLLLERDHMGMGNIAATLLFSCMPLAVLPLLARAVLLAPRIGLYGACVKSISRWSYSMYLAHLPIFFLLYELPGYAHFGGVAKIAIKLLGVVLTLIVSSGIYRWFELPMLARLSPRRAPH